jgi:hypothetical protein
MSSNSNDKWLIQLVPRGDESLSAEGWIKGPEGNRSGMVAWKKINTGRITKADVTALEGLMGNVTIGQTYSVPEHVNIEEAMGLFASMSLGTGDKKAGGRRRRRRSTRRKRTHRKRTRTTRRKRKRTAQKRRR